jgi:hypothetical protein
MMKNIAIPLLVAGSANAQRNDPRMAADLAVPAPKLIAAADYSAEECTNVAVTTALGEIQAKQQLFDDAVERRQDLVDALGEAKLARTLAVTAVTEKQAEMAAEFLADDEARAAQLAAQVTFDAAVVTFTAATIVDDAAGAVASAALEDLETARALKVTLDAAKISADNHVAHETSMQQWVKCKLNAKYDSNSDGTATRQACSSNAIMTLNAEGVETAEVQIPAFSVTNSEGATADTETANALLTAENGASNTLAQQVAVHAQDVIAKSWDELKRAAVYKVAADLEAAYEIEHDALAAALSTVAAATPAAGAGFDADLSADNAYKGDYAAMGTFIGLARTLSEATKTYWDTKASETWTAIPANGDDKCGTVGTAATDDAPKINDGADAVASDADCQTACEARAAWLLEGASGVAATERDGLPKQTAIVGGDSYCYGYALAAKVSDGAASPTWARTFPAACLLHESAIPASTAGYTTDDAGTQN